MSYVPCGYALRVLNALDDAPRRDEAGELLWYDEDDLVAMICGEDEQIDLYELLDFLDDMVANGAVVENPDDYRWRLPADEDDE